MDKPDMDKPAFAIFPGMAKSVRNGKCPCCGKVIDVGEFRDDLSRKEYTISGMCQDCQDEVFG